LYLSYSVYCGIVSKQKENLTRYRSRPNALQLGDATIGNQIDAGAEAAFIRS